MSYFRPANIAGRIAAGSEADTNGGCILWSGKLSRHGYGRMSANNRQQFVHRLAYALSFGPIPPGLSVCHRCDVPACINPQHLFLGTQADNMADKARKGRDAVGEANGSARLRAADIPVIRRRLVSGESCRSIARTLGVSHTAISMIKRGKRWSHAAPSSLPVTMEAV